MPVGGCGSVPLNLSLSKEKRGTMDFTNVWGEGSVFDWYHSLKGSSGTALIDRLEIRIEEGKPPHRLVLAYLQNGRVCRFDRRPDNGKCGTLLLEALKWDPTPREAADDYYVADEGEVIKLQNETQCELNIKMPPNTDLLLVLSACFAIHQNPETRKYTLLKYNCYFFSWTIVMVVSRHALPFVLPLRSEVAMNLESSVAATVTSLTNKISKALLDLVLDTITEFREMTGRNLNSGLGTREKLVWGLPTGVVRQTIGQYIKLRLRFGLEETLKDAIRKQIDASLDPILQGVLERQDATDKALNERLWIQELTGDFKPLFKQQIKEVLWDCVLDIIAAGYSEQDAQKFIDGYRNNPNISIVSRMIYRLLGENIAQFTRIWNAALHKALPASKTAGYGLAQHLKHLPDDQLHTLVSQKAFAAASEAALKAAQDVVSNDSIGGTSGQEDPDTASKIWKRTEMWNEVWKVWPKVWASAQEKTTHMVLRIISETLEEIVALATRDLVTTFGDNKNQIIEAVVNSKPEGKVKATSLPDKPLSLNEFQSKMIQTIRTAYRQMTTEQYISEIQNAMSAAWQMSREYNQLKLTTLEIPPRP